MTRDPLSPQWEDCKVCGGDHWADGYRAAATGLPAAEGEAAAREFLDSITAFRPVDAELVNATLTELSESPLPGARYAYEVVKRRFADALAAADRAEREGGELEHLRTAIANVRDISIGDLLVSWERQHGNYRVIEGGTLIEPPAADRAERGLPLDPSVLLATLTDRFHEARAGTPEWRDGIRLGLQIAMNEVGYWSAAALAADPQSPTGEGS